MRDIRIGFSDHHGPLPFFFTLCIQVNKLNFPAVNTGAEKTETISALQFKRGRVIRRRHTNAIKPGYPDKNRKRLIAALP